MNSYAYFKGVLDKVFVIDKITIKSASFDIEGEAMNVVYPLIERQTICMQEV